MFTGIVTPAEVVRQQAAEASTRLVVAAGDLAADAAVGDSVAVNGVCLTAVAIDGETLSFDCIRETLERSSLGGLATGDRVNLELALCVGDRLGGHFVSGHVDTTGRVSRLEAEPGQTVLEVELDPVWSPQMVDKGSIALDGVSLTLTGVRPGWLQVCLIPHTLELTNLGAKQIGDPINVETDLIAKHIAQLAEAWRPT